MCTFYKIHLSNNYLLSRMHTQRDLMLGSSHDLKRKALKTKEKGYS